MTRPADELAYYDPAHYRLFVTVDNNGVVQIEHQAGSNRTADVEMARLAAEIIDQIGPDAVAAALGADEVSPARLVRGKGVVVVPPPPGVAILGCRCGRVLDADELCRVTTIRPFMAGHTLPRIACARCAYS